MRRYCHPSSGPAPEDPGTTRYYAELASLERLLARYRTEYAEVISECFCDEEGITFEGTAELVSFINFYCEYEILDEIKQVLSEEADHPTSPMDWKLVTTNASVTFDGREDSSRVFASLFVSKGGEKSCALFAFNGNSVEVLIVC